MIKKLILLSLSIIPAFVEAAGPPGDSQIYRLEGKNKNQVVMLSNWPEGKVFSNYEDYRKSTQQFFSINQTVWIWCEGKSLANRIDKIQLPPGGEGTTSLALERDPGCKGKPLLLSNYEFPQQSWKASKASQKEIESIRAKLATGQKLEVSKIASERKGIFFLVFDPGIPAIYDTGGYRLMDAQLNQVSMINQAPLTPLIDLDGDGMPEFFIPSSDGMDAWLYRMFPQVDREMSQQYKGSK